MIIVKDNIGSIKKSITLIPDDWEIGLPGYFENAVVNINNEYYRINFTLIKVNY